MKFKIKLPLLFYWALGLAFFLSGAVLLFAHTFMRNKIIELTRLVNGTDGFDNWLHPKAPLTINFYFFNISNIDDFEKGAKPNFQEVGPFVYKEAKVKELNSMKNGSLAYKDQKFYFFDDSNGFKEQDVIMSLNLPIMVVARVLEDRLPKWVVAMLSVLLEKEPLMMKLTVKEMLWGYNASFFSLINRELHKLHLPTINFPQFGIFSQGEGNGSYSGLYEVKDGMSAVEQVAQITRYNHHNKLSYWSGDYCNEIKGTDGSLFHPFVTPSQSLDIFSIDICRSLSLQYDHNTPIHSIPTLLFTIPPETFQSYHTAPENQCFCTPNKLKCLKSGVMDISSCKMGAPIVVSLPHFLFADAQYHQAVTGLHPSSSLHRTNIYVEPNTGIVLKAEKRLQINFLLQNFPLFKATRNIKNSIVYPVVWLEENGSIDEQNAAMFYDKVTRKVDLLNGLTGVFVSLGICACVLMALQAVFTLSARFSSNVL